MKTECESISIRREDDDELGLFIYAVATLTFERDGSTLVQELRSGGLGDVQGDEAYMVLVGEEQRAELVEMLDTLGLKDPDEEEPRYVYWFSSYEGRQDPVAGPEKLPRGEALAWLAHRLRDLAGGSTVAPPRGWSEWGAYASDRLTRAAKTPGRFLRVPALDAGEGRPEVGCWVWVGYPDS